MKTPLHIFSLVVGAILIAAVGLAAGYYFKTENISIKLPEITAPEFKTSTPEAVTPNNTLYDISPPSRGPAISLFSVNLVPKDNKAEVTVSAAEAMQRIKPGQYVLLYKADGSLLEILGEVTEVIDMRSGDTNIHINLNGDSVVSSADAVRGDIILSSNSQAERIPLSAIVKDQNGVSHVWEVLTKGDTQFARYKEANVLARTYNFVVIEQPDSISNVFILNPDSNLRDGQKINTRKLLYAAPFKTEESIVSDAIEYRTPREAGKDPYKGKAKSTCGYGNVTAGGAAGCGGTGPRDVVQDFIQKIRTTKKTPAPAGPMSPAPAPAAAPVTP